MSVWRGLRAGLNPGEWTLVQRQIAEFCGWCLLNAFMTALEPWWLILITGVLFACLFYFRGRSHQHRQRLEDVKKRMQPVIDEVAAARQRKREYEERRWN